MLSLLPSSLPVLEPEMSEDAIATSRVLPDLRRVLVQFRGPSVVPAESLPALWQPSAAAVEAMQRLVQIVRFLRSPESGWEPTLPQTAETLTPYVAEEATDLLDALEESLDSGWKTALAGAPEPLSEVYPFHLLEDLAPQVLWSVAQTAPQTMRLLEGMSARVALPGMPEMEGVLRLSVAIALRLPDRSYTWDLVTRQSPALLPPDAQIRGLLAVQHQPVVVEQWLTALLSRIQQTGHSLDAVWQPLPVSALLPGQDWQMGTMVLRTGFEFVPTVAGEEQFSSTEPDPERDLVPRLQFTAPEWAERYRAIEWQTEMAQRLPYLPSVEVLAGATEPLSTEEAIALLIQDALQIVNHPLPLPWLFDLHSHHPGVALDRCLSHLSWLIGRTDYRVMQLLGGIPCTLIQPEHGWQSGILRFRPVLCFQTEAGDWRLDLLRQCPLAPNSAAVSLQSLVQSPLLSQGHRPLPLSELSHQVQRYLHRSPTLDLWRAGTAATLQVETVEDTLGTVLLQLEFDFVRSPE